MREWLKERSPSTPETEKWEKSMAWNIFIIEKECNQRIDEDYPLMKFFSLVENLNEYVKKEEAQYAKMRKR